jgi:periplasmic nitrate reductase NapD
MTPFVDAHAYAPSDEVHIASCVVTIRSAMLTLTRMKIELIGTVEIAADDQCGKLIVLIEGTCTQDLLAVMDRIRRLPNVLSIDMVYQHAEPRSQMEDWLS